MWGSWNHWGDKLGDLGLLPHVLVGMVRDQVPHNLVGSGKGWLYPLGGGTEDLICPPGSNWGGKGLLCPCNSLVVLVPNHIILCQLCNRIAGGNLIENKH